MHTLLDAHNHLQDPRLDLWREGMVSRAAAGGIAGMVVNGTCEEDWAMVGALAEAHDWMVPSFGLHPWWVRERGADWLRSLERWLRRFPRAAVGEIGLDRWKEGGDWAAQEECFEAQWRLAVRLERPITVHCLKAFGWLEERLSILPPAPRGFLLHSYGGPVEMVPKWLSRGAYFSVSPYFAHPRKAKSLSVLATVPSDRLLIETDAPEMRPPPERNLNPLVAADGSEINDPLNLAVSFALLVEQRGVPEAELAERLEANWRRLFGAPARDSAER